MSEIEITTVQPKQLDFSNLEKEKYMAKKYEMETLQNSGEIEPITPTHGIDNLSIAIDNLEQISICAKKVFEDGKVSLLGDSKYFLQAGAAAWRLVKVLPLCLPEITDLDKAEYKWLSNRLIEAVFGYVTTK